MSCFDRYKYLGPWLSCGCILLTGSFVKIKRGLHKGEVKRGISSTTVVSLIQNRDLIDKKFSLNNLSCPTSG